MGVVDTIYEEFVATYDVLGRAGEISLQNSLDGNSRKSILLSAASYFENALANIVEEFARNSSANTMVGDLIKARVISRQYHTWFDWDKNNANKFYQMFGDVFREHMTSLVRNRVQFDEAAKAFLEIGRDRNRLVHQDFGSFDLAPLI
ncbi:HEPN domain-containing protein [Mesorhizobium sp. M0166]|uniref:HEPN domain-containing protein n=1 Tax=Mesorhizobium sp. M0166 TaxID=2956902 RepID=UPI003336D92B